MKIKLKDKKRIKLIGERIKKIREKADITMEKIEEKDGPCWRFQAKIENNGANFSIATLLKIADALGVEPSELLKEI